VGPLEEPERLGRELAAVLLEDGAADIISMEQASPEPGTTPFDASRSDRSTTERAL
jgi:hypothetical protein